MRAFVPALEIESGPEIVFPTPTVFQIKVHTRGGAGTRTYVHTHTHTHMFTHTGPHAMNQIRDTHAHALVIPTIWLYLLTWLLGLPVATHVQFCNETNTCETIEGLPNNPGVHGLLPHVEWILL